MREISLNNFFSPTDSKPFALLFSDGEYLGCFNGTCLEPDTQFVYNKNNSYSPDRCTRDCRKLGFRYAGIRDALVCMCACNPKCNYSTDHLPDTFCGVPCSENNLLTFCGGKATISVYEGEKSKRIIAYN